MKAADAVQLGISNLAKSKLRTILTTLGVVIGIGALVSMVSFGTGMQKNVSQVFYENDLLTSLLVTPQKVDMDAIAAGDIESATKALSQPGKVLNDSALQVFQRMDGVILAYPQISIPVKLRLLGQETQTTLSALPAAAGRFSPYDRIPYGAFFSTDSDSCVVIGQNVLRQLKLSLDDKHLFKEDSTKNFRSISADSLLSTPIEIISTVFDFEVIAKNPFAALTMSDNLPTREITTCLKITGILKKLNEFERGNIRSTVIVPTNIARGIPRLGFNNIWDLMKKNKPANSYSTLYVRVKKMEQLEGIKTGIQDMGYGVFSISDQLQEIKKGFVILDSALGAVGAIALVVAALGIINTMIMSILERTREIGIMKSIGGSENEIKGIFLIEAGAIGLMGGIFGLLLGWIVTRVATLIANIYFARQGIEHVELFYIPWWLIVGAIGFAVLVSLAAGLYPAARAARVNPVEALRHE